MSAIFGIINKEGGLIDEAMLARMQQSLLHRAVDGKNVFCDNAIMFGHNKLIIHRRQTNEQQPLATDDYIITCDARIDNIQELTAELELSSSINITDSLIILKAYERWGDDCADHLEGAFAFAIWNRSTKCFYAASDHIGFRTFYYYDNEKIFAFASEIKALECIKSETLELNEQIFFDHYTNIHHPVTYDKNIHVLPSAHYLSLQKNFPLKLHRFWFAKPPGKYKFRQSYQWHECLLKLITKKIESQIDSDYPVGIMLSGGLDSSFVAAIACDLLKKRNKKLIAVCSVLAEGYRGADKDERFYIEKLKMHFDNLEVHYVTLSKNSGPYSNLDEAFARVESPVNTFHYVEAALFDYARKLNIRTLLSGFGGDMTISYNGNGVVYNYLTRLKLLKALKLFIKRYKIENYSLLSMLKMEIFGYSSFYTKIRDVIKKENNSYYPLEKEIIKKIVKANKIPNKKQYLEKRLNNGEIGSMLLRLRKHSISYNVEFLSPILDKKITELFFDIPGEELMLNGLKRSFIKETMKNLVPREIINRTDKLPFSPDYNSRIANINVTDFNALFINKHQIESITKIDFETLAKLIEKISHSEITTEWQKNNEVFFIPIIIISAKFYWWLRNKNF